MYLVQVRTGNRICTSAHDGQTNHSQFPTQGPGHDWSAQAVGGADVVHRFGDIFRFSLLVHLGIVPLFIPARWLKVHNRISSRSHGLSPNERSVVQEYVQRFL